MAAVENIEWLNQNLLRAYPLREDSDMTPTVSGGARATGLMLPMYLISDFSFTLAFDAVSDGAVPCLTSVTNAGTEVSLSISLGGSILAVVSGSASDPVNTVHVVTGQGDNSDCCGWIVLGDIARAAEELPQGVYEFADGQVPFEVSTLGIAPRGVRSITAVGRYGLTTYDKLTGNVKLIAGSDMRVLNDGPQNAIWLQAESNTGYERTGKCPCGTDGQKVVKTVNGMNVENIHIVGDGSCIDVTTRNDPAEVKIADTCSTPCCGCAELNFVEAAAETIGRSIATLNAYAETLRARIDELRGNIDTSAAAIASYPA